MQHILSEELLDKSDHKPQKHVKYGGDKLAKGHNLALWAYELKFVHPTTKENMTFKVYPPEDIVPWNVFDLNIVK